LAQKHGIKYFMNGGNLATESIMPSYWQAEAMDSLLIKDIYKRHVGGKIGDFKLISFFQFKILFRLRGYKQIRPLNDIPYGVDIANQKLEKIGWKNYERKHGESIFTKFFQNYFLVERYGYDKRRPHFSSRILSKDLTRKKAKELLESNLYSDKELEEDKEFISKKLNISLSKLDKYLTSKKRLYTDFRNWDKRMALGKTIKKKLLVR